MQRWIGVIVLILTIHEKKEIQKLEEALEGLNIGEERRKNSRRSIKQKNRSAPNLRNRNRQMYLEGITEK